MRLARRFKKTIYFRPRITTSDDEGNTINGWGIPITLQVNVQPAGGSVNAAIYGEELSYMKSIIYQGDVIQEDRDEKAGIDFKAPEQDAEPDYQIASITTYSDHLIILVKKVNHG